MWLDSRSGLSGAFSGKAGMGWGALTENFRGGGIVPFHLKIVYNFFHFVQLNRFSLINI